MSASTGLPASARAVLAALETSPAAGPARVLVVGGTGTGKSTALEAVRHALRSAGLTVLARVPEHLDSGSAVVIDDAHLLPDSDLHRLTELANGAEHTVVVATQARDHHQGLRILSAALERERPRITLGPLPSSEVARAMADPLGHPPSIELLGSALTATAGIPFLVAAVGLSPRPASPSTVNRAVGYALGERLRRLDERDLETLLITSLSTDLGAADLAAALDATAEEAGALIDRARGTGLIEPSHRPAFRDAVHHAAAQALGTSRHHSVESALLYQQLQSSTLTPELAFDLAGHGVRATGLADWLRSHAADVRGDPAGRVRWYRAAVEAGANDLRTKLAEALASAGDCAAATGLADVLLASPDPAEAAAGARIAASVATHDGNTAHAADVFSWLGNYPDATVGAAAAIVHIASGDATAARAALDATASGPPTALARGARSLADGILLTATGPYPAAAAKLGQSVAGEHTTDAVVLPDSASALVTLAALHSGDAARARSVIGRAVRAGTYPAWAARHQLLQGWVRMQDGQLSAAAADADAVDASVLHGRDALWLAALRTAIARRGGDAGALQLHWFTGMDVLAEYSIDLFSLLPLGELWMAAARLREHQRLAPAVDQAFAVLTALGEPATWAPLLHWAGVHVGILAGDPAGVAPHGQALAALADRSPFATALASAGRTWLRVLANHVDADDVVASARSLAQFGLTSDATRLTSQAALQARDPKVSALMLQVARDLKLSTGEVTVDPTAEPALASRPRPAPTSLSDREREVAELLLLGMPYRDIGAQLFISAKTVEHHVARIRRRLGAQSRSEMLSMLRAMLGTDE